VESVQDAEPELLDPYGPGDGLLAEGDLDPSGAQPDRGGEAAILARVRSFSNTWAGDRTRRMFWRSAWSTRAATAAVSSWIPVDRWSWKGLFRQQTSRYTMSLTIQS
jgi:hypothetical protein